MVVEYLGGDDLLFGKFFRHRCYLLHFGGTSLINKSLGRFSIYEGTFVQYNLIQSNSSYMSCIKMSHLLCVRCYLPPRRPGDVGGGGRGQPAPARPAIATRRPAAVVHGRHEGVAGRRPRQVAARGGRGGLKWSQAIKQFLKY